MQQVLTLEQLPGAEELGGEEEEEEEENDDDTILEELDECIVWVVGNRRLKFHAMKFHEIS